MVTLMVMLVPWRLVGAAEIWRAPLLASRLKPLRKTLMTGCSLAPKGLTRLDWTVKQFWHELSEMRADPLASICPT